MDLAVSAVVVEAEGALLASLSVPPLAVEAADQGDCLSPSTWLLTGPAAPLVTRVEPLDSENLRLVLDAPLAPGATYELALSQTARGLAGEPVDTSPRLLVGKALAGVADQPPGQPGADLAFPLVAGPAGDLAVADRLAALRLRVVQLVSVRRGAFTHLGSYGRGVEPKRSYSLDRLAVEAARLKTELLRDPDVKSASVDVRKEGHVALFDLLVVPTFDATALRLSEPVVAGGSQQ